MRHSALKIQQILNAKGFKTLAAGGYVRDILLGKEPKDIDLATQATPEQMIEIFKNNGIKYIETGLKHGTLTAIMDGLAFEVTTLRIDKDCDGRHAEVEFTTDFKVDASRRDFTINAMFMDLETSEIFDYYSGREDLEKQKIRFVGKAEDRIKEDFLRVLRAYRFSAILGFLFDIETHFAVEKYRHYLVYVSPERIRDEMLKTINGEYTFLYSSWLPFVIPELRPCIGFEQNNIHHEQTVINHTLSVVKALPKNPLLRFAGLMHDIAKPFCYTEDERGGHFYEHHEAAVPLVDRICDRLKFSTKDKEYIKFIVRNHMRFAIDSDMNKRNVRRLLRECEEFGDRNIILDLLTFREADIRGQAEIPHKDKLERQEKLTALVKEVMEETPKIQSPLNGREIMEITKDTEGKRIGELKGWLVSCIENGILKSNDKEHAIDLIWEYLKMEYEDKYKVTL